jgi:hypothetical protein
MQEHPNKAVEKGRKTHVTVQLLLYKKEKKKSSVQRYDQRNREAMNDGRRKRTESIT